MRSAVERLMERRLRHNLFLCSPAVERVPEKVSGVWLFMGTRMPVKALFENLEDGASMNDFLEWFPGVSRERVGAVLEHAERSLEFA